MESPVAVGVGDVACQFAKWHRLGVRLPGKINVVWDSVEQFAGSVCLALKLRNELFLNVHSSNLHVALPA
jgi:hypothetical protein